MVFAYIIQSLNDEKYYIGITINLYNRLRKHNRGGVRSTKNRGPFKLVYFEKFENYQSARAREKEIKSYKGGNSFKALINK